MITIKDCQQNVSIQDLGRPQAQHLGFSSSGAADEFSFLLANQLVNNPVNTACFEIVLGNVTMVFSMACYIVVTGADCNATINQLPIKNNVVYHIQANEQLRLYRPKTMMYSYVAIAGGITCRQWMHSASYTYNERHIEHSIQAISPNDSFHLANNQFDKQLTKSLLGQKPRHYYFHHADSNGLTLRFIPSNLFKSWTNAHQRNFIHQRYQISKDSDKMGYRLEANFKLPEEKSTLSKPVTLGTIQLPADSQPIILMKNRQTVGGYPVVGTVIQTDIFRLSQKRPGEKIRFCAVSTTQAQAQLLAYKLRMGLILED